MGGTPRFMLVAIAIPPTCSMGQIQRLYRGMMKAARPYHISLVGGDTSASRRGLFLSITLTGIVKPGQALLRSGARVGDRLYVTGTLGDSHAGLELLTQSAATDHTSMRPVYRRFLLSRHHRPSARVAEGLWLVKHGLATAPIDVSDGLSGDLRHLCEESGVGADIVGRLRSPSRRPVKPMPRPTISMRADCLTRGRGLRVVVHSSPQSSTTIRAIEQPEPRFALPVSDRSLQNVSGLRVRTSRRVR